MFLPDSWSLPSLSRFFLPSIALPLFFELSGIFNGPIGHRTWLLWMFGFFYVFCFDVRFCALLPFFCLGFFSGFFFTFWFFFVVSYFWDFSFSCFGGICFSFPSIFSDSRSLPGLSQFFLASRTLPVFFFLSGFFFLAKSAIGLGFCGCLVFYVFCFDVRFCALL